MTLVSRSVFAHLGSEEEASARVADRVRGMTVSAIKQMQMLGARHPGAISLGQGIPYPGTPHHIRETVAQALRDDTGGIGRYSLAPGEPALRRLIAREASARAGREIDPDREVCVTVGAMEALSATLLSVVDPGDEVLLPSPTYSSHIEQVLLAGGVPTYAPLDEEAGWRWNSKRARAAITPRTRAILLANPNNPTGTVLGRQDLEALLGLAEEHDLWVISDETYEFLVYGTQPPSLTSLPGAGERVIGCYSFSKKYCMTGWRVGYLVAPPAIYLQSTKVHDAFAICAPTISQVAARAALEGPQDCVADLVKQMSENRERLLKRLDRLSPALTYQAPAGAYYVFARYDWPGLDSMTLSVRLLQEAGVVVVPGVAFGPTGENHLRLSFAGRPEEIDEGCDRLEAFLRAQGRL